MIWGYQTTILGNIHMLATTNFQNKALPPKNGQKTLESTCFVAARHCFFSNGPVDRRVFWGDTGFFRCPPVLVGRHRGCHCGPNNVSTPGALGVGPEGGGFFMKEDFFCWRFTSEFFFWGKKMTGHFSSTLVFKNPKDLDPSYGKHQTLLVTPLGPQKTCFWHPLTSQGFLGKVNNFGLAQCNENHLLESNSWFCRSKSLWQWGCLLQRLIPYWFWRKNIYLLQGSFNYHHFGEIKECKFVIWKNSTFFCT